MCLAVPMRLIEAEGNRGVAEIAGVRREVALDLVQARLGDYLIVHAGYAIEVLDEEEANKTLALLREYAASLDEPLMPDEPKAG
jgi:hydrogenase expression/formation protein HypC